MLKSKDLLYQVSSDLTEVNSFFGHFSDESQNLPSFKSLKKPAFWLILTRELLFLLSEPLSFLDACKDKGLHMVRSKVFDTWNLILFQICFKACPCNNVASVHQRTHVITLVGGNHISFYLTFFTFVIFNQLLLLAWDS